MNILAIDTATEIEITVACSEKTISENIREVKVSHSATLFNNIDLCLKELQLEPGDLDVIGVGIGPGSFTGIRIAVTTARMFAQLLKIPLVGVKTHLFYSFSANEHVGTEDNILVAFDAKKNRVFGALYKKTRNHDYPLEIIQPGDYGIEYLLNKVDKNKKTYLIGGGCEKYYNEIKSRIPNHSLQEKYRPSGESVCGLVKKIYSENPDSYNSLTVVPFYARKSDAEILKDSR